MLKYIFSLVAIILLISSCDQINPPYTQTDTGPIETTTRKVFIEEFTGALCKNCPRAHLIVKQIEDLYPDNVIVMAIHAGAHAVPNQTHPYEFRTAIGNEIDNYYDAAKSLGTPLGMVNRATFKNRSLLRENDWLGAVQEQLKLTTNIEISMTTEYDETTRRITLETELKYISKGSRDERLAIYIVEDSIVKYQLDGYATDPDRYDYVHNAVLRAGITNAFGVEISDSDPLAGEIITKDFQYTIAAQSDWRPNHLRLIAVVTDSRNRFRVIQAEEVKVTE